MPGGLAHIDPIFGELGCKIYDSTRFNPWPIWVSFELAIDKKSLCDFFEVTSLVALK